MTDNIQTFITNIASKLDRNPFEATDFTSIENFPLNSKQCLYILDWQNSKISFQRNIKHILGYEKGEFTLEKVLGMAHPDDLKLINKITQAIVNYLVNIDSNSLTYSNSSLNITYRFRKKDGSYIKILRQSSLFERTEEGLMKSNLSLLTDISFFDKSDNINWDFIAPKLNQEGFRQEIYQEFKNFFTKREIEIINLISKHYKTKAIAEKLFISEHTAYSHRKNILRKSSCHSTKELLSFCHKIGVLK